ncbi:MAG: hypothetical protein A2Z07_08865 [Armatimonadetes bacterium RBG_16_67_12]|nr:MAG: hypothetical protein A2Z07_08865 [Armatimonadetes bacterium RBG_16_67_12]
MMRSVVVLPHPDGPRRVMSSPSRISRLSRLTATTRPNRFVRLCSRIDATTGQPSLERNVATDR